SNHESSTSENLSLSVLKNKPDSPDSSGTKICSLLATSSEVNNACNLSKSSCPITSLFATNGAFKTVVTLISVNSLPVTLLKGSAASSFTLYTDPCLFSSPSATST